MISTASIWTIVFAAGLGFLGAVVLTLGFALPALLGAQSDVARMSAAMFTISYSEALIISVLSGAAWDCRRECPLRLLADRVECGAPPVHADADPVSPNKPECGGVDANGQSQAHARLLGL
jgi:hypothetical protein